MCVAVREMLADGVNVCSTDDKLRSPLHIAVASGNLEIGSYLDIGSTWRSVCGSQTQSVNTIVMSDTKYMIHGKASTAGLPFRRGIKL